MHMVALWLHFLPRLQPKRVGDHGDRQTGMPQGAGLGTAQRDKRGRANRHRCRAPLGHFNTVVDTPRRTGASVARARDHYITLPSQLLHDRWRGGDGGGGFAALDDAPHAILAGQQRSQIVHQVMKIWLGVVNKADDGAREA